jgi:hypothetical protein
MTWRDSLLVSTGKPMHEVLQEFIEQQARHSFRQGMIMMFRILNEPYADDHFETLEERIEAHCRILDIPSIIEKPPSNEGG